MAPRRKAPSPILGAVREMIADASDTLVTENSRFKHTFEVAIDKISPDPDQPRKYIDDEAIAELARTMEECRAYLLQAARRRAQAGRSRA